MASFGQDTQTELPPSQSFFKNPFSIRNILNLSEEPQDRCAQNTSNQRFPIVPQVVRPLEFGRYTNVEVGLACYRTTQRLSALRNFPPWLLGTRFMRFLPGKWMKTKRCYLVHVHLRNFYTRRVDVAKVKRVFTALSPTLSTFTLESAKEKEENSSRTMIYGVRTRPDFDGREVDGGWGWGTYICKCYCNGKLAERAELSYILFELIF